MVSQPPFVSVVMPIRNEAFHITRCLESVLAQSYPPNRLEVIVSDGVSTDATAEIVRSFQSRHPNLQLVSNPGRIVPTGLNLALRQAKGEIIIRVDGHCEIAPDYVSRCVEHLTEGGADGVGGPVETVGGTPQARAIASAMSSGFGVGGSAFRTVKDRTLLVDSVAFPAYTRAIMDRAGPFDEELVRNQDDEYNYRLRKLGAKILLAGDVRSRYYCRASFRSLWRQYFQYGYWKVRVMQKHPRQMKPRQFAPPLFAAALLTCLFAAPFSFASRWVLVGVAGSYVVANLAASILLAARREWRLLPYFPVTFAILHLAYGLGVFAGLVKFWNRWRDRGTAVFREAPVERVGEA